MTNLDYWNTFVGEETPEEFMRIHGSSDPELCVTRFLEVRGHLFGVVNQGSWRDTFQLDEQTHRLTVRVYLLSYLEETRAEWGPALEVRPPSIPRRFREKFDQDKYPPPPADDSSAGIGSSNGEEAGNSVASTGSEPAGGESEDDDSGSESTADDAGLPAGDDGMIAAELPIAANEPAERPAG